MCPLSQTLSCSWIHSRIGGADVGPVQLRGGNELTFLPPSVVVATQWAVLRKNGGPNRGAARISIVGIKGVFCRSGRKSRLRYLSSLWAAKDPVRRERELIGGEVTPVYVSVSSGL